MGARTPDGGFSRRRRVAAACAVLLLLALVALWLARRPIAERFVDRTLAAAKVPARYTIADLGLGEQRLTNVVIGDPRRPDLVADWIETRTRIGLRGPELAGVRAGRLRLRGRLVDGRLSLGVIDRLLPKPGGGGLTLPALDLRVADGRMRLETPYGVVGLSLIGSGRLDDGFAGRLALVGERLGAGDCAAERVAAAWQVRTAATRVRLSGPLNVARARCGGVTVAGWRSDISADLLTAGRRGSTVRVDVTTGRVNHPQVRAERATAKLTLRHEGAAAFALTGRVATADVGAGGVRAESVALDGTLRNAADGGLDYAGTVALAGADAAGLLPPLAGRAAGTPLAPLLDRAAAAASAAARRFSGEAQVGLRYHDRALSVTVPGVALTSASGAQARLGGGQGIVWRAGSAPLVDGIVRLSGGGLPSATARIAQPGRASARQVVVTMAPYASGGARLALTPVKITGDRIATRATLSGPLADGRVDGLTLPLDLRLTGVGLVANRDCTPIAFDRLAVSTLTLDAARLRLCPAGGALLRVAGGRVEGGGRLDPARLSGRLGGTPVSLALGGATLDLAARGFTLDRAAVRLGQADRVTRFDIGRLDGRVAPQGVSGRFADTGGQIGAVPLLLGEAAGDWRFAGGTLLLTGALRVSDAETAAPRFQPMAARDVTLRLQNGAITAKGMLHEPVTGTRVASVTLAHALGPGTGTADLRVEDLRFTKDFQPNLLTPLTYGVVADVVGTVAGSGHIAWSPEGVTSTGRFRTAGIDLAAAFGPVTGIAGELTFTDLLGLKSAPGQVATVKSINPGIAVTDGTIRYQILPDTRVRIESGEWPFAGGRLTLDPTLLDFADAASRRMTFHVRGVAADRFLQQFDFKNLDATGTFDGTLPMVFDATGGRIEGGQMTVREGGGTIAYVGDLSEKDLGFWGNFAFQALKSIRYRSLALTMNGPLAGEMVTDVRFAGVSQGEGAKSNFLIRRLQRLPLVFNVRIKAPFRGLLDSAQSFYDPSRLIQRNLPTLLDQQGARTQDKAAPVQPPASDAVPR